MAHARGLGGRDRIRLPAAHVQMRRRHQVDPLGPGTGPFQGGGVSEIGGDRLAPFGLEIFDLGGIAGDGAHCRPLGQKGIDKRRAGVSGGSEDSDHGVSFRRSAMGCMVSGLLTDDRSPGSSPR